MNVVLRTLSFLFFAFTTQPSLATSEPVLDSNGDPLLPTSQYYVLPHIWPGGGGLGLAKTGNQSLPLSVIQEPYFANAGKAIVFKPNAQTEYVPVGKAVGIEFAEKPEDVSTAKWLLVNDLNDTWSIGIGYSIDHPGFSTLEGYFWIHKHGSYAYTLSFLPFIRSNRLGVDIGRINNDGFTRLVAKPGDPYPVIFRKAASSEVAKM